MTKRLVVFLHGLDGHAVDTWAQFPTLLRYDHDVAARYTVIESWQYSTSLIGKTDSLDLIADALANYLNAQIANNAFDEIAFITHSQGGLLARRYLANVLLDATNRPAILPIYRLLTFATPHWGAYSDKASRYLPDSLAQQKDLAYDSDFILTLNKDWAQADADEKVWVCHVVAVDDKIVPKFSAFGANFKNDFIRVPGYGHSGIVIVDNIQHPSFEIAKAFLLKPTTAQPALLNPDKTPPLLSARVHDLKDAQGTGRFVYTTRYIPFVGREREVAQLEAFLTADTKDNFAWMWVKGEGGVGKSRLALELCLAWQNDLHAGFLRTDAAAPDWPRWQPRLPTLIVVDYATADIDKLNRLLRGLSDRDENHRLRRPVRLLLLDRHQQEDRLQQAIGTGAAALPVIDCRQADLTLSTVDDPWALITHFFDRANQPQPDRAETLACLVQVDPAQRPLFAMLLADALVHNADGAAITRESLLGNVIERERDKYWRPAAKAQGVLLAHAEHLLAFATVTNGLQLTGMPTQLPECDPYQFAPVFEAMAGYNPSDMTVAPLAPDLLGECFALAQFNALPPPTRMAWLQLAWQLSPVETFQFLDRVAQDFPEDSLLTAAIAVEPESEISRFFWSMWIVNLIHRTGNSNLPRAKHAYAALVALAEAHPDGAALRLHQATAAFNLITHLGQTDLPAALQVFKELCALAKKHPDEAALRLHQAQAAVNLITHLGQTDLPAALQVFKELCALAKKHPDEAALRLHQAQAAVNLINGLGQTDLPAALQVFKELCALAKKHPDEAALRLHQAQAAVNLIIGLRQMDLPAAQQVFKELCALAEAHPDEAALRLHQAQAAFNLIIGLGQTDLPAAQQVFKDLCALAEAHPTDEALHDPLRRGVALIIYASLQHDPEFAQQMIEKYGQQLMEWLEKR